MKNKWVIVLPILGSLAVLYGVISFWFGQQTEGHYRDWGASMNRTVGAARLDYEVRDYRRGIFSSEADSWYRITLPHPAHPTIITFAQHDRIQHGPVVWSRDSMALGLAAIHSGFSLIPSTGANAPGAQPSRPDESIFQSRSVVHMDGAVTSRVWGPPLRTGSADGRQLVGQGLQAEITYSATEPPVSVGSVKLPGFSISDGVARVSVDDVKLSWEMLLAELVTGTFRFRLEDLQIHTARSAEPVHFAVRNFTLDQVAESQGDSLDIQIAVGYQSADWNGHSLGPGSLSLRMKNLHTQVLIAIQRDMRVIRSQGWSPDEFRRQALRLYFRQLPALLGGSPQLEVENLHLKLPAGQLRGRLFLAMDGQNGVSVTDPGDLIRRVSLAAEWAADRELVLQILSRRLETALRDQQPQLSEAQRAQLARENAPRQLTDLIKQGLVEESGGTLRARLVMESGSAVLNGNAINLFQLMW